MQTIYYVRARRNKFPNAEKRIAGPFGSSLEAGNEANRLRPEYSMLHVFVEPANMSAARVKQAWERGPITPPTIEEASA